MATPAEVERTYILLGREDKLVRGAFALRQRAPHQPDCGYVLARQWWRQGLMTEILTEVTAWALRQGSVYRFVREGLLRRWLVHPNITDEPRDCYSYARVR